MSEVLFSKSELSQTLLGLLKQSNELDNAAIYGDSVAGNNNYRVMTQALDSAKLSTAPFKISFPFRSIAVLDATDANVEVNLRLSSMDSSQDSIPLKKASSLKLAYPVKEGYLHWDAQASKSITILFILRGEFSTNQQLSVQGGGVAVYDADTITPQTGGTAATTAAQLFAANGSRKMMVIQNLDSQDIYIGGDSTITDDSGSKPGIRLTPGQSYEWRSIAACYVIAGSAGGTNKIGLHEYV